MQSRPVSNAMGQSGQWETDNDTFVVAGLGRVRGLPGSAWAPCAGQNTTGGIYIYIQQRPDPLQYGQREFGSGRVESSRVGWGEGARMEEEGDPELEMALAEQADAGL